MAGLGLGRDGVTRKLIQSATRVYSAPDHLCLGRTVFVVITGPAGPYMNPDQIFLYSTYI